MTQGAFAKLNLTLDVLGKREDGYHDLKMVMQTISLHDDVTIELDTHEGFTAHCYREVYPQTQENRAMEQPEVEFVTDGLPQGEENLAFKAALTFFDAVKKRPDGMELRICKRIPMQAGLAGGSADAAAVLRALNRHYGDPFSVFALCELGARVGSDVPFCVLGGTALAEGRGERLTPIPGAPEMYFVVCKPEFSVSTPALFSVIDGAKIGARPDTNGMLAALQKGDLQEIANRLCNVFDPIVTREHLELNYIKSILMSYGAYGTLMTGTGSAVFGIFDSFEYAAVACTMLKDSYHDVFIAKNV